MERPVRAWALPEVVFAEVARPESAIQDSGPNVGRIAPAVAGMGGVGFVSLAMADALPMKSTVAPVHRSDFHHHDEVGVADEVPFAITKPGRWDSSALINSARNSALTTDSL